MKQDAYQSREVNINRRRCSMTKNCTFMVKASQAEKGDGGILSVRCHGNTIGGITK